MITAIIVIVGISIWYYIDTKDGNSACAFAIIGSLICVFLSIFSGHSDVKKKQTRTETVNGKKVRMVLMRYIGTETYTTPFGRKVWKEKWVTEEEYRKKKFRPYVTRPWEARFFD